LGVVYQLNEQVNLFGGVHKGFTAPSNSPGLKEEEAINYELGVRFSGETMYGETMNIEATYFLSDYDNLLGECTGSSGSDCEIGDAFNGDAATVQGLELMLATNLASSASLTLPLQLSYTYIDGEFDTNIADTAFFGDVSKGDPIPYIPKNQLNLSIGLVAAKWNLYFAANYVDETCVRASCNAFEKADSTFSVDVSGAYQFSDTLELFARIENLTGEEDILGRQPYGARPNKDTTASVGARLAF